MSGPVSDRTRRATPRIPDLELESDGQVKARAGLDSMVMFFSHAAKDPTVLRPRRDLGQQFIRDGSDRYIGTVLKKGPPGGGL